MDFRRWACLLSLFVAGCRLSGSQELLERELRQQEDKIYELKWQLEDCQDETARLRRENERLRAGRDISPPALPSTPPARTTPPQNDLPQLDVTPGVEAPPEASLPGAAPPAGQQAPPFKPPLVLPPSPDMPEGQPPAPPPSSAPPSAAPPSSPGASSAAPPSSSGQPPRLLAPLLPEGEEVTAVRDDAVTSITLNRHLTGGYNADATVGDEGVTVLVEPRSDSGDLVLATGDVEIVVLDPARQGPEARVAKWDFTAQQAAVLLRKMPTGGGLHFELPWPDQPPTNRALRLYVRFTTSDGRKLVAEQPIDIEPSGNQARQWSSATQARRPAPAPRYPSPGVTPTGRAAPSYAAAPRGDWTRSSRPIPQGTPYPPPEEPVARRPAWSPYR